MHPVFCPLCSLSIFCPLCILYSADCVAFLYSAHCASCILPPCILFLNSPIFVFCHSVSICYAWPCILYSGHCIHPLLTIPPLHPWFRTFLHAVHSPLCSLLPILSHCAYHTLLYSAIETSCDGMRVVKVSCPSLQNICRLIASYIDHICVYLHLKWPCVHCPDSGQCIYFILFLSQETVNFPAEVLSRVDFLQQYRF